MNRTIIKDLAPSSTNPRNSEGGFITLNNGDILFAYSRYGGDDWRDHAQADLYGVISKDNGLSFGEPFPILYLKDVPNATNIMCVSFIRLLNGDIGMFFMKKSLHSTIDGLYNGQPCLIRSSDEGKTWYDLQIIDNTEEYMVLENDRVIRLDDGSLFFVVAVHPHTLNPNPDPTGFKKYISLPSHVRGYISKDDGKTWQTTGEIEKIWTFRTGLQEPGVIQKQDGSLYTYIRCDLGFQLESVSLDQGKTWTIPHQSRFTSPISPMSLKRLSNGDIIAVWNPYPMHNDQNLAPGGMHMSGRNPLAYAISKDDGATWLPHVIIENTETNGYCYTAIHETEDAILLAYCAGGPQDGSFLNRLRISRILKDEL